MNAKVHRPATVATRDAGRPATLRGYAGRAPALRAPALLAPALLAAALLAPALLAPAVLEAGTPGPAADPRDSGLSTAWLVFGFAAQGVFGLRFLLQWIASERAKESVVPRGFWVLSLVGGVALFFYFLRRGDPVGMAGQIFGVLVYSRNLYLLEQKNRRSR